MNKENVLFAVCGFLMGLIIGALLIGPKFARPTAAAASPAAPSGAEPAAGTKTPSETPEEPAAVMEMVRQKIDQLKSAITANPEDADALAQLGNLYMDAGKFSEAIGYYQKAVALRSDPDVATDLGICYRESGSPEKALEIFQKIGREHSDHWQSLFNEAVVLVDLKRFDQAAGVVARLKQLRPNDADVVKFEQALTQLRK